MIVAFDISQYVYGTGVSIYIQNLIAGFSQIQVNGLEFKFFGFSRGRFDKLRKLRQKYQDQTNFKFYLLPWPERARSLSLRLKLDPKIIIGNYDLLHTPDWVGYHTSKPAVATVHDLTIHDYPSLFHEVIVKKQISYLSWLSQKATRIISVSQYTREKLKNYYPNSQGKIKVIYEADPFEFTSPTDWGRVRTKYKIKTGQKYFLSIATLEPRKNLNRLIQAFKQVKLKDYQLMIAGRVGWGNIKIEKDQQIKLLGYVPDSDLLSLLKKSAGLLYPSIDEGFGLPIAAAMAHQLPLVSSNLGSMKEISQDYPGAVLVDPLNTDSISQGITKLTQMPSSGSNFKTPFSWVTTASQTLSVYQEALTALKIS